MSLKGNAYFLAQEITDDDDVEKDVIQCFDFTTERFGLRPLLVPFLFSCEEAVTLSAFRDQKLALLHQKGHATIDALEIWITTQLLSSEATWS